MRNFPKKRPSNSDAIEARAAAWLAQRDDGLSPEDELEFAAWRAADPRHSAALARLEITWAALRQLRDYRPTARALPDRDILAPQRGARVFRFPHLALVATAAALSVVAYLQWPRTPVSPELSSSQVYSTTIGGYQRLTLPDGSIVELNDNSEVRVRYTAENRRVQLTRGQAHFTVAKNPSRPFLVETSTVALRAVGTAFDVRLGAQEVEVLVTEGLVELNRVPTAGPRNSISPPSAPPVIGAGWRALVPNELRQSLTVEMVSAAHLRDALSWQGPRLVFVETPLREVIAQFNRRNDVKLSLGDPELADIPVGGSFRAENVETFVRLLSSAGEIAVERPADNQIVLRKVR